VALVLLVRDGDEPGARRPPVWLGESGSGEQVIERPLGEVEEFDRFEWTWEARPGESFVLTIWPGGDLDAEPVVASGLKDSRWTPDAEERARFGAAIRFRLTHLDASENVLGQARGEARLRSPSR
jgi:hypothetical protein